MRNLGRIMPCKLYNYRWCIEEPHIRVIPGNATFKLDEFGSKIKWVTSALCSFIAAGAIHGSAHALDLPKEVTPEIRAACERDVRRLCVRSNSTLLSVKTCVVQKFNKLNVRCRFRLMQAGLWAKHSRSLCKKRFEQAGNR